jgi:hypothetical protein
MLIVTEPGILTVFSMCFWSDSCLRWQSNLVGLCAISKTLPPIRLHWFRYKLLWTNIGHDWTIFVQMGDIRCRINNARNIVYGKIDYGGSYTYGLFYGGILQIYTAGMGGQSRLHGWQFSSRKRIVIEWMRVIACSKTSLTETHMATWTITFRWLTEYFCSWFPENGAYLPSCFVTLSDGSRCCTCLLESGFIYLLAAVSSAGVSIWPSYAKTIYIDQTCELTWPTPPWCAQPSSRHNVLM